GVYNENVSIQDSSGALVLQGTAADRTSVVIRGGGTTVIDVAASTGVTLRDLTVTDGGTGVSATGTPDLQFLNVVVAGNRAAGIHVSDTNPTDVQIADAEIRDNTNAATGMITGGGVDLFGPI